MRSVIKLGMIASVALASVGASASVVTEYNYGVTAGKDAASVALGTSIAADAGDVIVFTATSSKAYTKSYSVTSGDGGAVGVETSNWGEKNASVSYFTVTAGGTFDLGVAGNDATFDTFGAYVLGSDQAGYLVVELAQAQNYEANHTNSPINQLNYGTLASGGTVIEAAQANFVETYPAGYNVFNNGAASSRAVVDGSFLAGDVFSTYVMGGDLTKNSRTTGIAFAEVIPEPATLGMVALFGSSILFIRRRFMM